MAASAMSDVPEGPVLSLINKRIRALRKKHNRIIQMEESLAHGKVLNKEQEEVLRSKPGVVALIEELEKLRQPLSAAVREELSSASQNHQLPVSSSATEDDSLSDNTVPRASKGDDKEGEPSEGGGKDESGLAMVEDLLQLLYFGTLFDVKPQSEYTSTMLTRTHERGCCLTYDYVTDDATDLLGERDLDLISTLGGLLTSRPLDSSLSHKSALESCIEHSKQWLSKSSRPVNTESPITYAALREKLNKIMASYYFTATPEIKDPVEMAAAAAAAAAGNYDSFQVPVDGSTQRVPLSDDGEESAAQHQQKEEEDTTTFEGHRSSENEVILVEGANKDEPETEKNYTDAEQEWDLVKPQVEVEQNNLDDEPRDQQLYGPQRSYPNQRGGRGGFGGGRRGYPNGRVGRGGGGRGLGSYQAGRNQYHNPPGNYQPKAYYYNGGGRGRGGRGGQPYYNNHSLAADVKLAS